MTLVANMAKQNHFNLYIYYIEIARSHFHKGTNSCSKPVSGIRTKDFLARVFFCDRGAAGRTLLVVLEPHINARGAEHMLVWAHNRVLHLQNKITSVTPSSIYGGLTSSYIIWSAQLHQSGTGRARSMRLYQYGSNFGIGSRITLPNTIGRHG